MEIQVENVKEAPFLTADADERVCRENVFEFVFESLRGGSHVVTEVNSVVTKEEAVDLAFLHAGLITVLHRAAPGPAQSTVQISLFAASVVIAHSGSGALPLIGWSQATHSFPHDVVRLLESHGNEVVPTIGKKDGGLEGLGFPGLFVFSDGLSIGGVLSMSQLKLHGRG